MIPTYAHTYKRNKQTIKKQRTSKEPKTSNLLSLPGARYPNVPATIVVMWGSSSSNNLARPKSDTLASKFPSSKMLLDLMSQ